MAEINVQISLHITLTTEEFRIVRASLDGHVPDEWKEKAAELSSRLFKLRNSQVASALRNLQKHAENEDD